ncbi:hypothetical protein FLAG1_10302 [Fusarium langsethiae]|uniref:WSC domain-containing protein n=1 Tax=Fusarium langsethiae TaxID=179993 RepID=A0A0M9ENY5_FUSLA|nr:hypothetical protein FLAG1_10302 [Fusarium langsethiae]GKU08079.1 unnamed protein product [Fusarium langsethiae]GKU10292.1 unnamed protein product [Fusarium langsethiae]
MWFQFPSLRLIVLAVLLPSSNAFSVATTNDANTLAAAIFGQGITITQASFSGASVSSGTFADGPFGIGSGAILTSGSAIGALPNGDHYVNNGASGSDTYCGSSTFNAALLTVDILINPTYNAALLTLLIFLADTQYALDANGNKITARSPYLASPLAIRPPNSVTSYPGSSPPLWIDILATGTQTMVIAICDLADSEWDSGLLIKAEGCIDCDTDIRLAYVTTTTTLPAGEATYTSTTAASGTESGTILIAVVGTSTEEPTTTTADVTTTTTADESTTTTAEATTTTTQESTTESTSGNPTTTTTQDNTTSGSTETSTEASSTVISSEQLSDTTTTTLATSDTTTESSTIATESDVITTTTEGSSTQTIASTETIITSDSPIDGTSTSSSDVKTSSTTSTASTSSHEPTESSSSAISTDDTAESLETTTVQQNEPSTDTTTPSSGTEEETSSSIGKHPKDTYALCKTLLVPSLYTLANRSFYLVITSTADNVPTPATSSVATSSIMPSNLAVIGNFRFFGCLGSPDGYPSFELIGETPDMTTEDCVRLGTGRAYIGIYQRSCYAADTLDSADAVSNGRCDLPCPGDPGLFCGGVVDPELRFRSRGRLSRRDAPPGILLTLYSQIDAISGSQTVSDIPSTADAMTTNSLLPTSNPTISLSAFPSTQSFIDSAITTEPSVPITRSQGGRPIVPPFPTSAPFNAGNFTTNAAVAPIVTTITYMVVDPNNPSYLTVTEFCSTLRPSPCHHCQYQQPPTVEMTTIKADCNACGHWGENTIILEVPAGAAQTRNHAAYETHRVQYHEDGPYEQKPRPGEEDSHTWQNPRPQNAVPGTGDRPYKGNEGYKFDKPQIYHTESNSAGGNHNEGEAADVTKTEPKPDTARASFYTSGA